MEISYEKEENKKISRQEGKSRKGGFRTMPFIIANETFEKVASVGLQANMILYLTKEYHMSSAAGTNVLFLWSAISNFMPTIGAFLSDSYLGRFRVIALGTFISLLGLTVLWITAIVPQATPPSCNPTVEACISAKPAQLALLYSSFALMAIGAGGIRPCSLAFGADQLQNPNNPNNERLLQSFFNWYYASVGISIMISVTVIVYIQDKAGWIVGFGVPVGLMFLSAVLFLMGSSLYVKMKANKSLFTGFAQVISAAWKNRNLALPPRDSDGWYHYQKGSKFTVPTEKLRFLNKACIIRNPEKDMEYSDKTSWNVCTVRQVEELKALIKVLPIWSTGIIIGVTISQHSFPVLQAVTMDRRIFTEKIKYPAGSFGLFAILTLTIWVAVYDRIVVPLLAKFTKRRKGLSNKERIGIGLAISCLAMATSALVERKRRDTAIREGLAHKHGIVSTSAFWLVPQYCLIGLAEAFNAIGQIEFYYSQFPKSMSSIGVALMALGIAVGNVVGALIISILDNVTKRGGKVSWVATNLNMAHYDYYYWILCFLSVINLFYYLVCSWAYGSCEDIKDWDEDEVKITEELSILDLKGSPLVYPGSPLVFYSASGI
ncbi:protein NRT1/ PTR FAMILY 1.1-like [Pistacia vera]|uniref:protein NRT1/ PTR FAMILY 1.1-like n=1 Tax=Pistacia vera TaxID=55513 RepID=UPI001262F335|nr:protein NRT1/ PTR FAMILY 1.1-like [Pistacia vera]XP_031272264.1 protein NRT1/ PTR FAMILY 1.1-like [Pistacia vera]